MPDEETSADPPDAARPTVFIAYARDDDRHLEAVRSLYHLLAQNGTDPVFDLPAEETPHDWTIWLNQVFTCDYVLIIASPRYKECDENLGDDSVEDHRTRFAARNVRIRSERTDATVTILGVVLPGRPTRELPNWMGRSVFNHYPIESVTVDGIDRLLRALLRKPYEVEGDRRQAPELPARPVPELPTGTSHTPRRRTPRRASAVEMPTRFTRAIHTFEGREQALAELVRWLGDVGDPRSRFVTGCQGAGKTALLGVLAHLGTDPRYRRGVSGAAGRHRPPERSIDVALFAGGLVAATVLEQLADVAGMNAADVGQLELPDARRALERHLRQSGSRLTVLLDGLDEVGSPEAHDSESPVRELDELCSELLLPLVRDEDSPIRFLLGARGNVLQHVGFGSPDTDSRVIDLDEDPYWDGGALHRRVRGVLLGDPRAVDTGSREPSRWRDAKPAFRRKAVERIVEMAGRSFQVGEAIARSQAGLRELPGALDEQWWQELPTHAGPAMREDLARRLPHDMERAVDLLRPLAYARGGGMPWADVWLVLANALKDAEDALYTDADLDWIVEHASSYVVDDRAARRDRPLYSLHHQMLSAYLREGRDTAGDERRIFERLFGTVGEVESGEERTDEEGDGEAWIERDWSQADEYLRSYLLEHALAGGRSRDIDALVWDPGYLAYGRDNPLRSALGKLTEPGHRAVAETYSNALRAVVAQAAARVRPALADRNVEEVREFLAQISLAARCGGAGTLARRVRLAAGANAAPWRATWASWRRQPPHLRLSGHVDAVRASAVGVLRDGRQVVVTAGDDGDVRIWDVLSGSLVRRIDDAHPDGIGALAVGRLPGPEGYSIVVSGSDDWTARAWDLDTGEPAGTPFTNHRAPVRTLAVREWDGALMAVSGGDDGAVRVWNPRTGVESTSVGDDRAGVTALAVVDLAEEAHVLSGDAGGQVQMWNVGARKPEIHRYTGHLRTVRAVAVGRLGGRPVAVSAGDGETIHVWDPATGEQRYAPLQSGHECVRALAITAVADGQPVILSGGDDRKVRVWDLHSGRAIGAPFAGHEGCVRTLAVARSGDRVIIVSGGEDRTPKVWDLMPDGPAGDPFAGHENSVRALHWGRVDGRSRVVTGGSDATVRQWDPDTGRQIGRALTGHRGPVTAVSTAVVAGRSCVLSAGLDTTVRIWDLSSGDIFGEPFSHRNGVTALLVTEMGGATKAVSATLGGEVLVWDLETHVVHVRYDGHRGAVRALCPVSVPGRGAWVVSAGDDGLLHVWDPATGELSMSPPSGLLPVMTLAADVATADGDGPDGSRTSWVAAGGNDGVVVLHDLSGKAGAPRRLPTMAGPVRATATVHRGGSMVLVSGHENGRVRFWDTSGHTAATTSPGHAGQVRALTVGVVRGRPAVFSGGDDHLVRAWDVEHEAPLTDPHRGWVRAVAILRPAAGGEWRVVSGSDDDTIQIRGLADGRALGPPLKAGQRGVRALAVSDTANGPVIVAGGADSALRVLDDRQPPRGGRPNLPRGELSGHRDWVRALVTGVLDGHPVVVSASGDTTVRVWNLDSLRQIGPTGSGHSGGVRAVAAIELAIEKNGLTKPLIVSGSTDQTVRVSLMETGRTIATRALDHGVRSLAATRLAGTGVVISGDDGRSVLVWDALRLEKLGEVPHGPGEVRAIAAHQNPGNACTWVAVAAGETITLSSWTEVHSWREVAMVDLGADVLSVAMVEEYWEVRRPGRLVVGATHGVVVLEIARLTA